MEGGRGVSRVPGDETWMKRHAIEAQVNHHLGRTETFSGERYFFALSHTLHTVKKGRSNRSIYEKRRKKKKKKKEKVLLYPRYPLHQWLFHSLSLSLLFVGLCSTFLTVLLLKQVLIFVHKYTECGVACISCLIVTGSLESRWALGGVSDRWSSFTVVLCMCRFAFVKRDKLLAELFFLSNEHERHFFSFLLFFYKRNTHRYTCSAISEEEGKGKERESTMVNGEGREAWKRKQIQDKLSIEWQVYPVICLSWKEEKDLSFCTYNTFTLTHGRKNMANRRGRRKRERTWNHFISVVACSVVCVFVSLFRGHSPPGHLCALSAACQSSGPGAWTLTHTDGCLVFKGARRWNTFYFLRDITPLEWPRMWVRRDERKKWKRERKHALQRMIPCTAVARIISICHAGWTHGIHKRCTLTQAEAHKWLMQEIPGEIMYKCVRKGKRMQGDGKEKCLTLCELCSQVNWILCVRRGHFQWPIGL